MCCVLQQMINGVHSQNQRGYFTTAPIDLAEILEEHQHTNKPSLVEVLGHLKGPIIRHCQKRTKCAVLYII